MFGGRTLAPAFCISLKKICRAHAPNIPGKRATDAADLNLYTYILLYRGLPAHFITGTGKLLLLPHPEHALPILCISKDRRKKKPRQWQRVRSLAMCEVRIEKRLIFR